MQESHHHIGHLHAGVVDVVLHVHLLPGGAQQAHERIAQDCVAQVADVRGLVGIDAGVLDEAMDAARRPRSGPDSLLQLQRARTRPIQPRIDVSRSATSNDAKPSSVPKRRHNLLRNYLGRFSQLARQLERDGRRQFAKLQLRRNLQRNGLKLQVVLCLQNPRKMFRKPFLQFQDTRRYASKSINFPAESIPSSRREPQRATTQTQS